MIHKYRNNIREEGERKLKKPDYDENGGRSIEDDKRIYDDDLILKATEPKQIYGVLESFARAGNYRGIGLDWGRIAILTRALGREIRG